MMFVADCTMFVGDYIRMIADGFSAEALRASLERERDLDHERVHESHVIYKAIGDTREAVAVCKRALKIQPTAEVERACEVDKGHGRLEIRRLLSTTMLNGYLDWPDGGGVALITWHTASGDVYEQEMASRQEAEELLGKIRSSGQLRLVSAQVRRAGIGPDS